MKLLVLVIALTLGCDRAALSPTTDGGLLSPDSGALPPDATLDCPARLMGPDSCQRRYPHCDGAPYEDGSFICTSHCQRNADCPPSQRCHPNGICVPRCTTATECESHMPGMICDTKLEVCVKGQVSCPAEVGEGKPCQGSVTCPGPTTTELSECQCFGGTFSCKPLWPEAGKPCAHPASEHGYTPGNRTCDDGAPFAGLCSCVNGSWDCPSVCGLDCPSPEKASDGDLCSMLSPVCAYKKQLCHCAMGVLVCTPAP